jgi:hypothetical protein
MITQPPSYAIAPVTDKQFRGKMLQSAHHWLYRRGCTKEDATTALKLEISFYVAASSKNREWRGNPDVEKAIREAPENQAWIAQLIQEALEGAAAVQSQMQVANG